MELQKLFAPEMLDQAQILYKQNKVIIIKKELFHVEAIVYDELFYLVTLTFNHDYSIVHLSVSHDGYRDICPFSKPYAAALLYKLFRKNEYGITYDYTEAKENEKEISKDQFLSSKALSGMQCYNKLLVKLTSYILRIQNYNTDSTFMTFSQVVDDLFEYIDAIKSSRERLVAIQLFLHIYMHLEFDFERLEDIHYAILDESNYRIHQILENELDPQSKFLYQSLLSSDYKISSYLCDYNKTSFVEA